MSINTRFLLNSSEDNSTSVKVLEPFQPEVINCDDKDAFNVIYNTNKEKYDAMTTQKLNKIFNIPGYKITKVNNQICLRSIKPCEKIMCNDNSDTLQKLTERVVEIEKAFNNLANAHNKLSADYEELVKYINQGNLPNIRNNMR